MQLIVMNYHIFSRADYLMKKRVAHQSPEEEDEDDAQKKHYAKEKPTSAEKLGPRNKTTA